MWDVPSPGGGSHPWNAHGCQRDFYPTGAVDRRLMNNDGSSNREIIGVVQHVAAYGLLGPETAKHQFYLAADELPADTYTRNLRSVNVAVRSHLSPEHLRPLGPAVFTLTIVGLLACAALAAWIPARRAVRVDASVALRDEG